MTTVHKVKKAKFQKSKKDDDFANKMLITHLQQVHIQMLSTFWLSVFVMIIGFGILIWGVSKVFITPDSIMGGVLVSVSGVVTEFIGATFLFIYKSISQQAENLASMLERFGVVNKAEQILESVPKNQQNQSKVKIAEVMVEEVYRIVK